MDPQGKILIDMERCVRGSGRHEDDIEENRSRARGKNGGSKKMIRARYVCRSINQERTEKGM